MKTLIPIFALVMLLLGSCDKEPKIREWERWDRLGYYMDTSKCKLIESESNMTYVGNNTWVSGCIRPVSELIRERDSLMTILKDLQVPDDMTGTHLISDSMKYVVSEDTVRTHIYRWYQQTYDEKLTSLVKTIEYYETNIKNGNFCDDSLLYQ